MFGMFYAYAEEYKHNDCIFKDKTNLYNMYKIILKNLKKNTGLLVKYWVAVQQGRGEKVPL